MILKSKYDFYRMNEVERKSLIGKEFKEKDRDNIYFPIGLSSEEFNYGVQQGLIFVTFVMKYIKDDDKVEYWFRVGASSPDDLDADLDFQGEEKDLHKLRKKVLKYIRLMTKENWMYRSFLKDIQEYFGAGGMTS